MANRTSVFSAIDMLFEMEGAYRQSCPQWFARKLQEGSLVYKTGMTARDLHCGDPVEMVLELGPSALWKVSQYSNACVAHQLSKKGRRTASWDGQFFILTVFN